MRRLAFLFAMLLALLPALAFAEAPIEFRNGNEEARFRALAGELRCVMCQNQSLADSDAPIAQDLRRQVLAQMRAGRSDTQIKQYLVARYSEFVLYEPGLRPATFALWFGPLLVLLAGGALIASIVHRRGRGLPPPATPTDHSPESDQEW